MALGSDWKAIRSLGACWRVCRASMTRCLARQRMAAQGGRGPRVLVVWAAALFIFLVLGAQHPPARESQPVGPELLQVGFTFSQRQTAYLGLPWRETFDAALELSPRLIRLGAYWDEIERVPGRYDFSTLDWLIASASERGLPVVLTVGMKAPRWPEYYLPPWLARDVRVGDGGRVSDDERVRVYTLAFIRRVVERYRDRSVIAYWQVENEPLDPAGDRRWRIGADFLREEVALVRALDYVRRPIIVNLFVQPYPLSLLPPWRDAARERAEVILDIADILGLDIYPSIGLRVAGVDLYVNWSRWGWEQPAADLKAFAVARGKDAWVIEAQAEPWEPAHVVYTKAAESRSVQVPLAVSTFERLQGAGFANILLWGVEHWYMRLLRYEDRSWWDALGAIVRGAAGPGRPTPSPW